MIQRYAVVAAFFWIAACAGSSPQAPEPVADAGQPVSPIEPVNPIEPVTSSKSTDAGEQLEVVEVPQVHVTAHTSAPPELICHCEQELGSRRIKRVCRTKSEIDQMQDEAEQTLDRFRNMRDTQIPDLDF